MGRRTGWKLSPAARRAFYSPTAVIAYHIRHFLTGHYRDDLLRVRGCFNAWLKSRSRKASRSKVHSAASSERYNKKTSSKISKSIPSISNRVTSVGLSRRLLGSGAVRRSGVKQSSAPTSSKPTTIAPVAHDREQGQAMSLAPFLCARIAAFAAVLAAWMYREGKLCKLRNARPGTSLSWT
jgi:hypothetical protein